MHASADLVVGLPQRSVVVCNMQPQPSNPPPESSVEVELKRSIRELLDVLPKDVLEELNGGSIDLKDPVVDLAVVVED